VGGGIPIAVGAAIGARVKKEDRVTLCFFGDGASNTGSFHESLNLAAVLRLPVVFVCENNRWAVSTPVCYSLPVENVADRAASYGMPGAVADGSDPLAVYEAVREAAARARRGEGPTLVEAKTYRWEGHFRGDPETYRSREEVNDWRQNRDPLRLFAARLKEEGIAGDEDLAVVRAEPPAASRVAVCRRLCIARFHRKDAKGAKACQAQLGLRYFFACFAPWRFRRFARIAQMLRGIL
jgi:TPP-dependent pyruvate/acetoin dehydrogenase alpha subunit